MLLYNLLAWPLLPTAPYKIVGLILLLYGSVAEESESSLLSPVESCILQKGARPKRNAK